MRQIATRGDAIQPDDWPDEAEPDGLQPKDQEQLAGGRAVVLDPAGIPEVLPAAVGDSDSEDLDDGQPHLADAASRAVPMDKLTFSQAQLVELLSELTTEKADNLLRMLGDRSFKPAEVVGKWPTKASINEYLNGLQVCCLQT